MSAVATRPRLEVADILRAHAESYCSQHAISPEQATVLRRLVACRTAALGGHVDSCDACGFKRISYNSCRDRHCPKCQSSRQVEWLETRLQRLLPVGYFHVVFTLPRPLQALTLKNRRVVYELLFRAASVTLLSFASDPQRLGAQIGITAVLHTWGQNLLFHPHLHCVVTGGGLSADGRRWVATRQDYLFPVKALARLFRGKFLAALRQAYQQGGLEMRGSVAMLKDPCAFERFMHTLYRQDWIVYAKPPFGGAEQVYRYLGRYTHRVAISNSRLLSFRNGRVRFRYIDYAHGSRRAEMTLSAEEFIRRFLLHVLPKGFVRIRHYGLLASRNATTKLEQCRHMLGAVEASSDSLPSSGPAISWEPTNASVSDRCPRCHSTLWRQTFDAPHTRMSSQSFGYFDTS